MHTLCVGQIVADIVVRPVDSLPKPGGLNVLDELQLVAGGCAANTACVLSKLGADVTLAGAVGCDDFGSVVLSKISACGVDTSAVTRHPDISTTAVVVVVDSKGERSFLYKNGANDWLNCGSIPDDLLKNSSFVHVGGAMKLPKLNLKSLLSKAKSAGCTTSLDTDWDPQNLWMSLLRDAMHHIDYLLTNEEEGRMLTGCSSPEEIGKSLITAGPQAVIVKCGADGAVVADRNSVKAIPGLKVDVLDTTCAGDAFVAGFLFGMAEGWKTAEAVEFANASGALCTTQVSHQGVTSLEDTLQLLGSRT